MSERLLTSPLSPERAWAISWSFLATIGRHLDDADAVGEHGAHVPARAAAAGRSVGQKRLDLVADGSRRALVLGACRHAQADFIGSPDRCEIAMQRVDAEQVEAQTLARHPGDAQALAHDLAGEARALGGAATGVGDLALADEAVIVAGDDFV